MLDLEELIIEGQGWKVGYKPKLPELHLKQLIELHKEGDQRIGLSSSLSREDSVFN